MSGIEKFPTCEENCIVFLKTMANPKRALICETMRACGECPKDKWCVQATETLEFILETTKITMHNARGLREFGVAKGRHELAKELLESLKR